MHRRIIELGAVVLALIFLAAAPAAQAQLSPQFVQNLYEKVKPSLVLVQYTYANELAKVEIVSQGVVVSEDGLVMASIAMVPLQFPDDQLTEFKILIPGDEDKEFDATFEGRDERSNVAFFRTKEKQHWPAIKFEEQAVNVGDPLVSIGCLPKGAGYHPYVSEPTVSSILRGPVPEVLVSADGLTSVGSPVFNQQGVAIGLVNGDNPSIKLNRDSRETQSVVQAAARAYIPARDFLQSLSDPPTAGHPLHLPWMGIADPTGLEKNVAELFNLKGQPAVQIGDVIPGTSAAQAGLKAGDIIVKFNGKALERGDEPDEAAQILSRTIQRLKVGAEVTFTVRSGNDKDAPAHDVTLKLEERPALANRAPRYFAEDTGFAVRDLVFHDRYERKLAADYKGVIVSITKPSSAAVTAGLESQDLITQINGQAVTDVTDFEKLYKEFRKKSAADPVILEILRGVKTETIRIEPPQ